MPKRKKGKVTVVQRSQLQTTYTPVIRIRRHTLSRFKTQLVLDAFLTNEQLIWERTSNCKITTKESGSYIRLLRRERATYISGKRLSSIRYDTVIEAENAAFDYRYSLESKKLKNLDEYKSNLLLRLSGSVISSATTSTTPPLPT